MVTVKVLLASGETVLEEVHLDPPGFLRSLRQKVKQVLQGVCFKLVSAEGQVIRESVAICDGSRVTAVVMKLPHMCSTDRAFALVKADESVVTWGDEFYGGDSSAVRRQLVDVIHVYSTDCAFAAVKADRTVVTWGDEDMGGASTVVREQLEEVSYVYSTRLAFAALKADGGVVT